MIPRTPSAHSPILFAFLALLFALLALPPEALAQRRGEQKAEPMFPNATREDKQPRASSRIQREIQKMFDAYNEEDDATVEKIAGQLLANAKAGEYAHAMANRLLAEVANNRDDLAAAIGYLQKAIDADVLPNDQHFQSMLVLGQLLGFEEREEEALAVLRRFMEESGSTDPQHRMMLAQSLYRLERYDEAAREVQAVLAEAEKPDPNWKKLLLAIYVESEKTPEAIAVAESLLAADPDDKPLLMNLAGLYLDAEQPQKAADLLENAKARGLFTTEQDYERLYRLYYNIEGAENKTVAVIKEGLEKGILKPGHQVYNLLGQVYYFTDRIQPAIEAWTKAMEYAPDGRTALNLARVLYNEERYAEAKTVIQRALAQGLEQPGDGYVTLGNIELYGLNDKAAAVAAYNEALKYPGDHRGQAESGLKAARR